MEGHDSTIKRITTPALNWLRDVAIEVDHAGKGDVNLSTADILEIISDTETLHEIAPQHYDDTDKFQNKRVLQKMGRRLKACFTGERDDRIIIDNYHITRFSIYLDHKGRNANMYMFKKLNRNAF